VTELHVVRVFLGPDGGGGNPLGVFLDGGAVAPADRQAVAADLGFSETVFVDAVAPPVAGIRIHTPTIELPFAGHPAVGTAWLLERLGRPVGVVRVPAGDVRTWREGELTWIRARPDWAADFRFVEFATAGEVDDLRPPPPGDSGYFAWAWEDAGIGWIRGRLFGGLVGIAEDEATGAAALRLGARHGIPLTIRQGRGSELYVRPGPDGTVEVGGRVAMTAVRPYPGVDRTS
jgi:predicted PhzF superfamily epimerase YddE/YHI9